MVRKVIFFNRFASPAILLVSLAFNSWAQSAQERQFVDSAGGGWWFSVILMVLTGFGGAFYFWRKSKTGVDQPKYNYESRYSNYYATNGSYEMDGLDADVELEWLRKAKKLTSKEPKSNAGQQANAVRTKAAAKAFKNDPVIDIDTKLFQEKMRKLQYSQLPINSFGELTASKRYEPLPLSDDPSLLNAIEQADEEHEEDESVRELAVKILTAFRTRNSVDALAQIALYDLSSNLRSKAVSTLTDFDHPSVFEPILLACADPTREVRAAAARGLFRLNFDRADAWKRIIETNDEFRMSHAARAAIESGFAIKSFDRLVHEDFKVTYEAFTLVSLMIRSGETEGVYNAIRTHKDERIKFALLHVIRVTKDERTLRELEQMSKETGFSTDVAERIREVINGIEHVMA